MNVLYVGTKLTEHWSIFGKGLIYLVTEEIQNKAKLGFDLEIVINW